MPKYLSLALWIIFYLAISFGLGQITQGEIQGWYLALQKPSFNPPNWVFGPVWGVLYIMIATAGWKLWRVGATKDLKIIFILYTLMNWAWTPIFFGMHNIELGFFWIVSLSLLNLIFIVKAWKPARVPALLMAPLLFWTVFASVLNYTIWTLNS